MTDTQDWLEWCRGCAEDPTSPSDLTLNSLAMLTGQDKRACAAIAACWQLYASSDEDGNSAAIGAIKLLMGGMQPKCRLFVRELIPYALGWSDRDRLWAKVQQAAAR